MKSVFSSLIAAAVMMGAAMNAQVRAVAARVGRGAKFKAAAFEAIADVVGG